MKQVDMSEVPDSSTAKQLAEALNKICEDPGAKRAIELLWECRVDASRTSEDSPLVIRSTSRTTLGVGGMLNGIIATKGEEYVLISKWRPDGSLWGFGVATR